MARFDEILLSYTDHAYFLGEGPPILSIKNRILRLDCPGMKAVERTLLLEKCLGNPEIPLYLSKKCYTRENFEGEPIASKLYELIITGKISEALRLSYMVGLELAHLHKKLIKCNIKSNNCEDIVNERVKLAEKSGLPSRYLDVRPDCSRLIDSGIAGHGDFHLYQIIKNNKYIIIDYSGEPMTSYSYTPLEYDIASLLRSIEYIATIYMKTTRTKRDLYKLLASPFILGYSKILEPPRREVVEVYCRARVFYEYFYEIKMKTGLDWIPLRTLERILHGQDCIGWYANWSPE